MMLLGIVLLLSFLFSFGFRMLGVVVIGGIRFNLFVFFVIYCRFEVLRFSGLIFSFLFMF